MACNATAAAAADDDWNSYGDGVSGDFELSPDDSFDSIAAAAAGDRRESYAERAVAVVAEMAASDSAARNKCAGVAERLVMCPADAVPDNSNHLMD